MTRLRKMTLEELQRRNYSQHTTRYYIRTVEDFARHFNRPPDRCLRHIREYQAELFQKRKLSPGTVTNRLAALRFFYIQWHDLRLAIDECWKENPSGPPVSFAVTTLFVRNVTQQKSPIDGILAEQEKITG